MLTEQNGIQVDKFYPPTDWQYSFPEGYTRLEYLESTGTQWIDTNVQSSSDLIVDTEYYYESGYFFGYSGTIDGVNKSYGYPSNVSSSYLRIGGGYVYNNSEWGTNKWLNLHIENSRNNVTLNGVTFSNTGGSFGTHTFSNGGNITLGRYVNTNFVGKVKYFRIKQGNTLLRNLVPAKRNSDNKPGMYDLVNNVFYTNDGTGEFVMGPELYSNNSQIDIRQKNNTNFVEKYKFNENNELVWANPNLYLENVNNSYIQIEDFYNLDTDEIIVDFLVNAPRTGQTNQGPFYSKCSGTYGINMSRGYAYIDNKKWSLSSFNTKDGNRIILNAKQMNLTINGATPSQITDNTQKLANNLRLFRSINGYLIGKIFSFIWKRNGVEIYHLVPVKKGLIIGDFTVPSNGMFDIINQQFYENNGSGTFNFGHQRDLKVIPPEDNTITLLYGVKSDFSKYALFGLLASVSSGTYDVYIDDVLYATTASETRTDIDFSTLGAEYVSIGTCTTPEELVLHKIVIKPNTSGETITAFRTSRHSTQTGSNNIVNVLWGHLQLDNILSYCRFANYNNNYCSNLYAITAKNNLLSLNTCDNILGQNYDLNSRKNTKAEYIPNIVLNVSGNNLGGAFNTSGKLKRVNLKIPKNITTSDSSYAFQGSNIEQVNINGIVDITSRTTNQTVLCNTYKLKLIPNINISNISTSNPYISNAKELYPSVIKCDSDNTVIFRTPGTSTYPMRGLRGLKVSNEAPFSGTSPQINVSYTGLDRDALVELFNSLPDVSEATDGITRQINITAATGNNLTKVGTPMIDVNGVASGGSSSNYLSIPNKFSANKIEINIKFKIGAYAWGKLFWGTSTQTDWCFEITSTGLLRIYFNQGLGPSSYFHTRKLSLDHYYQIIEEVTKDTLYVKLIDCSNNSVIFTSIKERTIKNDPYLNNMSFLRGTNSALPSIDLENTYIKVGQNYIMKGYLTDNDRLIATNKGWTITG